MTTELQAVLGAITGLGLSAACGFRVFIPMLIASIAVRAGVIHVSPGFAWLGSTPALVCLGSATLLEIAGYYLPGVDHFLDVIATPAAIVAGTLLTASFITGMEPWMRWGLAFIAGGGLAGLVQGATVVTRAVSGVSTLGVGNPVVATGELAGATSVSVLAIVAPVIALFAVGALAIWLWTRRRRRVEVLTTT